MKNDKLTTDEYDALEQIRSGARHIKVNACVGRNAKKLAGLKLIQFGRDGKLALTEQGGEVLFLRRCVQALQALAADPGAPVEPDVAQFLGRKAHIVPRTEGGFAITGKGQESLADIAAQEGRRPG
ncbi:hypothetical protein [Massilia horti]|uniref:Uncharacterized protein n=1 Tax=Massilia horti TaxID=2562153 RepID=A0A4Y9TAE0_9BURK|nr:hypothetical protein [Massilia horti]TFW35677.1 hypothetical protein E4O92_01605 [Massilia horti]